MISYLNILSAVALRTNQIPGGDAASRVTNYGTSLISPNLDGVDVPAPALKQDILAVEKELAMMIANSTNELYRSHLAGRSASVANRGAIPIIDNASKSFIGSFDGIFDVTDNKSLTEQPRNVVERYILNPGSFWKIRPYYFHKEGTTLVHTRDNVYYRGCVWDYETQATAYDTATATKGFTFATSDVDITDNTITETAHGLKTGMRIRFTTTGTLPASLQLSTDYYAIALDADTFQVALSVSNALGGIEDNITDVGTGTHTLTTQGVGTSPLPQELEVLWVCKVLAQLAQEDWYVGESEFYRTFALEKQLEIVEGKLRMMQMPSMPRNTAKADAVAE